MVVRIKFMLVQQVFGLNSQVQQLMNQISTFQKRKEDWARTALLQGLLRSIHENENGYYRVVVTTRFTTKTLTVKHVACFGLGVPT